MNLKLRQTSALNLELQGSTGAFRVGTPDGEHSTLEVKYLLTHVSLDYENGTSAQVLNQLAPVRELFETEQLEFDEIMQRDIDDARVSSELVPYLLDNQSRDMVKLFPPIVVVVLPTIPNQNRPAEKYPTVEITEFAIPDSHIELRTRSGAIGQEVFEFIQPKLGDRIVNHDLNRLRINTARTKLVIVDGQHRAMALLALYRNLMQEWADERRAPYKDFYEEWTPNYIRSFEISGISLPVMFCTFPELDENYIGDFDLKKAARSIFLTLNKTARKVSESRNRLLDDNDLVALFLRNTLSGIKRRDSRSPGSLRIWNVELDQSSDRMKIESAIGITGVSHIYYITEHLLLNRREDINGANPRAGKFYKRTDLEAFGAYNRLDGRNLLGAALADGTDRNYFSREAGEKLASRYNERFGSYVEAFFVKFAPIEAHCRASITLEQYLSVQENRKLRPILFQGQGMSRVFNTHREILKEKLKGKAFGDEATKVQEIIGLLDNTAIQIRQAIDRFKNERAKNFLSNVNDIGKIRTGGDVHPKIVSFISDLYDNVFSSVAFQTAVIAGFFGEIEQANSQALRDGKDAIDVKTEFDSLLKSLHDFFTPRSTTDLRRVVEVFLGKPEGPLVKWMITRTPNTFREVVYPGEMQPDQWPKYRYMVLELWRPTDVRLQAVVTSERKKARSQIFSSLTKRRIDEFLQSEVKRQEDLSQNERERLTSQALTSMNLLLGNIGWSDADLPTISQLVESAAELEQVVPVSPAEEEEVWQSAEDQAAE
jgi:hypothetical protein